ncbi:amino-acid permease BAT1 homolog isoform X1 [Selaginella moellendorffii]|uniref:amino-acid permease BAT1 homolog isoform X1 n=1 Tax=Selaginella moellendorffii TaxID=88036 RepID=UPI000D1CB84A|nr:amino-acid permease BAT1 homolog isoform X1 [Selaginella moellendorffii]|eukprot:XP_024522017.1 amino-acid permease BAT1 homolog isoform X1 [Selaginella moellendorffii]
MVAQAQEQELGKIALSEGARAPAPKSAMEQELLIEDASLDPAERRLNQLGYKQELRREMTLLKIMAISFSTMTLFTGITPLIGPSYAYFGPAATVWGWVIVTFFTWFIGFAMAEICSSFPTTGSLYFWAAHLAGPRWGPLSSWYCAWLEAIGLIAAIGTQAYAGAQALQNIILLASGTAKGGGYLAPRGVFLAMYVGFTLVWAVLNTFALNVIALIDIVSMWWQVRDLLVLELCPSCSLLAFFWTQVIGGGLIVILLPLVAPKTQSASFVFTKLETFPSITGIDNRAYGFILSLLVSQYSLYGYDSAAHLTEETKGADINGPIAILSSIGLVSVFGWAYILALTFSIQDFTYLFDPSNETAGKYVPAQILYDAFHGRYHSSIGAILLLIIIWGSFFFGGLSITTSAARVVYALSRDGGIPYSRVWRVVHPTRKVPANAVWLCSALCILLGLPILKVDVVFTAITSVCTIGWVGGYAVPIFARMVIPEAQFHRGRFHLGPASRVVCLVSFLWICYTVAVFLLPTVYPIELKTFNYAPVALGALLAAITLWWIVDARKWFKGPVRNIDDFQNHKV